MQPLRFAKVLSLLAVFIFSLSSSITLAQEEVYDPIEPVNRGIFWFNDKLDVYFLEPVAEGYQWVLPRVVRRSIGNFFRNLKYPVFLVSDVVQLKFDQAANDTGRFLLNSTLGVVGLFEVAEDFGLPYHYEDFGIALGYHEVPPGPYLVIPLLGPSNARDAFGRIVDAFLNPTYYIPFMGFDYDFELILASGLTALDIVNTRADLLDAIRAAKESSLDYYLFVQSAYYQQRRNLIYDGNPPEAEDYDYEEELDTDFDDHDELEDSSDSYKEIEIEEQAPSLGTE